MDLEDKKECASSAGSSCHNEHKDTPL